MSDKRKLYTIVGGGFGGNIRQALVSYLYPIKLTPESASVNVPSVVSVELPAPKISRHIEGVNVGLPSIVSITLETLIKKITESEAVSLSVPSIVSAVLKPPARITETEPVSVSIPSVVSITTLKPIFQNFSEPVSVQIPTIVSITLTTG